MPLRSKAAAVPTAWEAVPIDSPPAIGLLMRFMRTMENPAILPKIPVQTTTAAVNAGMPPMVCETSMAIGVVTAFGARERTTSGVACNRRATKTTDTSCLQHTLPALPATVATTAYEWTPTDDRVAHRARQRLASAKSLCTNRPQHNSHSLCP